MRIGYGWDSHEFKRGIPLKIGGIEIAHDKGLGGHSDGDVLLHAITDHYWEQLPLQTLERCSLPRMRAGRAQTRRSFFQKH